MSECKAFWWNSLLNLRSPSDLNAPIWMAPKTGSASTRLKARLKSCRDHFVKEVPLYKWELCDGIINIVPVRGRSRRLEDFLRIQVQEFKGQGDMNKFNLRNHIMDLPEVELFLKVNNLRTERLRDYICRRASMRMMLI